MMTYTTPRCLSSLAARVYVEDLLLESKLFHNFVCFKDTITSFNMESLMEKFYFECEMNDLKINVLEIEKHMNEILSGCSAKTLESILNILRTTDHYCSISAVILQFLYDTEINFRRRHWILFPILLIMERKYTSVEKLIFDSTGELNPTAILGQLLKYLPNLKIFKGVISKDGKCLTALRKNCVKLTELTLCLKEGFFTSNQLTAFFFSGKQLDFIKKAFVKLELVPLSFPYLKKFSISGIGYEQYDFFKMFLHFYSNVDFSVDLHYSHLYINTVSWFDAVLSHSVVINPDICVSRCELNIHDLFLPFCERSLKNWKNLESLLICLGIQGKKNPATSTNIGKRLESLLAVQQNVKELWIRVQGPVSEDEVAEILFPSLKMHGKRFEQLRIIGVLHFMSHRSVAQVINLCPNIKQLVIVGKRISKYYKDVKLKTLQNLESLTIVWAECQTNAAFCQWISKLSSDLIKSSPNIKNLYCTANISMLEYMSKMKFGAELETLTIYFHTENSCDGVSYLKKILPHLPKLNLLVVKENHYERSCECLITNSDVECCICDEIGADSVYTVAKSYVDNTEIYMRYHTFEDAQIGMYL